MFIDASALVAILVREPEREDFLRKVGEAAAPVTSAIAIYEASHAVARTMKFDLHHACRIVRDFLSAADIAVQPVSADIGALAVEASSRYGKVAGHPARLNMGDCFSYAMAKQAAAGLLYKGDDFAKTDLA
ncbi:type II toxin-antitoxin system VapC family toxin [Aureimonas psammosilenae]|uniref:type II toxin-antitoxin system VapC family toxin n=1 Tax=Aureimonas psammosilenae TaxID=2495496 RepID=UPI001260FB6D|nr:type II toxin-antitoxin system VapC family toxin [Aureimonas psammosilenae]